MLQAQPPGSQGAGRTGRPKADLRLRNGVLGACEVLRWRQNPRRQLESQGLEVRREERPKLEMYVCKWGAWPLGGGWRKG